MLASENVVMVVAATRQTQRCQFLLAPFSSEVHRSGRRTPLAVRRYGRPLGWNGSDVTRGGDWGVIAQAHACGCGCGPFGPHQEFDGVAV